ARPRLPCLFRSPRARAARRTTGTSRRTGRGPLSVRGSAGTGCPRSAGKRGARRVVRFLSPRSPSSPPHVHGWIRTVCTWRM
ncbi:MAG: hypothetical protein AVDCRST_MAG59-98, partial [uncultured Thermomicrobiales bacterium]